MKKKLAIISALVICAALISGGTLAYFTDALQVHNVITSGAVKIELVEKTINENGTEVVFPKEGLTGMMPGTSASKIVSVRNTGAEAWVRVAVDVEILSSEGKELPLTVNGEDMITFTVDDTNWIKSDGCYYYKTAVESGKETEILFDKVHFAPSMGNEYQNCTVRIDVSAQAVQTANNPIPAGGNVTDIPGWPQS